MGDPIAIFPLINSWHPEAAMGIHLQTFEEFNTLMDAEGIEVSTSSTINFEAPEHWLDEEGAYVMSEDEISAYSVLLDVWHDDGDIWTVLVEHRLKPEHAALFRELGLYLRRVEDRKFRRLREPAHNEAVASVSEGDDRPCAVGNNFETLGERVNPVWAETLHSAGEEQVAKELGGDDYIQQVSQNALPVPVAPDLRNDDTSEYATNTPTLPTLELLPDNLLGAPVPDPESGLSTVEIIAKDGSGCPRLLFQPSVETIMSDEINEQDARSLEPLMDELAERFVLLTEEEAEMLEAVWIVYGDQWQQHC